ncbi:MAG: phosphate transport system regulatory protein PhoU [Rhodobacterales bacterium]|nr:MAG: phosphate transport system regulatory protein PhoU [Rhodobacterales bacterium]
MAHTHIVHAFDKDLEKIQGLLLEMGGLVENQIVDAMTALTQRDAELGQQVLDKDKRIDQLEHKISEKTIRLLALRQPMADDLRMVVAIMKVSASLERIGDYAKNIAKRLTVLMQTPPVGSSEKTLKRMGEMVQLMVCDVLNAFLKRDVELAADVRRRDRDVDLMNNTMFRELLTYMMEDPRSITACMHLLFIAKNIERAGDHTAGIADQVHYLVHGTLPDEKRSKGDVTSTMEVPPIEGS